jgi:hypothetical protein
VIRVHDKSNYCLVSDLIAVITVSRWSIEVLGSRNLATISVWDYPCRRTALLALVANLGEELPPRTHSCSVSTFTVFCCIPSPYYVPEITAYLCLQFKELS